MGLLSDPEDGDLFEFEGYVTWMTEDAVKVQVDTVGDVWIPFSQISDSDPSPSIGDDSTFVIPAWLAKEKGLA